MPKVTKKSINPGTSSQTKLASPKELADFRRLQTEVRQLIYNIHIPLIDLLGLTLSPKLIYLFLNVLATYQDLPIRILLNSIRMYCENLSKHIDKELVTELDKKIPILLKAGIPIENWLNYFSIAQSIMKFFKECAHFPTDINAQASITEKSKHFPELTKQIPRYHEKLQAFPSIFQVCKDTSQANDMILTAKKSPHLIPEITWKLKSLILKKNQELTQHELVQAECISGHLNILVYLTALLSSRWLATKTLQKYPFGALYRYRANNDLLEGKLLQITQDRLANKSQQLLLIKQQLSLWNQLSLWVMRIILLLPWLYVLSNLLTGNNSFVLSFLLIIASQPYVSLYALQGGYSYIQDKWQTRQFLIKLKENYRMLNSLSQELNLPGWDYQLITAQRFGYFILELKGKYAIDNISNKIPQKIIMDSIISVFHNNNVFGNTRGRMLSNNYSQITLPLQLNLSSSQIKTLIFDIKKIITFKMNTIHHKQKFEDQLRALASNAFTEHFIFYKTTDEKNRHQFNYWVDIGRDERHLPEMLNILETLYSDRVNVILCNNKRLIKINNNTPCSNELFQNKLSDLIKLSKQLRQERSAATTKTQNTSTPDETATEVGFAKEKRRHELTNATIDITAPTMNTPSNITLNFGKHGVYTSNTENFPQEIEAPYYPRGRHFEIFTAPREAFATDDQYNKYKNIRARVVNGKGEKGLVSSGNVCFFTPDGKYQQSSLKRKDPTEDLRVYDYVVDGLDSDGNKVHLHVFNHVLQKTH